MRVWRRAGVLQGVSTKKDSLLPDELPDVTPREVSAVRRASEADTDPGEGPAERPAGEPRHETATREHVAQTRPEGVRRRPIPVTGPDEVTDPHGEPREEAPTRPRDVMAVRRR